MKLLLLPLFFLFQDNDLIKLRTGNKIKCTIISFNSDTLKYSINSQEHQLLKSEIKFYKFDKPVSLGNHTFYKVRVKRKR